MKTAGKILIAFAGGAAVGAIVGILFAPDKGSRTRRKIQEEGMKIANTLEENIEAGKEKFELLRQDFEKKLQDAQERKMTHSMS